MKKKRFNELQIVIVWILSFTIGCAVKKEGLLFTAISSAASGNWQFVKLNILDKEKAEWVWGVKEDLSPMLGENKVGVWKCPYHNSRACLENISRINKMEVASLKTKLSII